MSKTEFIEELIDKTVRQKLANKFDELVEMVKARKIVSLAAKLAEKLIDITNKEIMESEMPTSVKFQIIHAAAIIFCSNVLGSVIVVSEEVDAKTEPQILTHFYAGIEHGIKRYKESHKEDKAEEGA